MRRELRWFRRLSCYPGISAIAAPVKVSINLWLNSKAPVGPNQTLPHSASRRASFAGISIRYAGTLLASGCRPKRVHRMRFRWAWGREYANLTVFSSPLGAEEGPMRMALPYLGIGICLSLATWLALALVFRRPFASYLAVRHFTRQPLAFLPRG